MIKRILEGKIVELARHFPVVALTGPRQSGKTTLVKQCFPTKPYVSLEDYDIRQLATEDPRGFLESYKEGAILDEAQKVPTLFSYLQTRVDADAKKGQFILTGSQNFLLHEKITQSLAGRVALLTLLPFSFEELKSGGLLEPSWKANAYRGFYPAVRAGGVPVEAWASSYLQTYLERDVRSLENIRDLSLFQKFLQLCAGRVGQLLNYSAVAKDLGVSPNTVQEWISVLEASFVVYLLKPYHKNFKKRMVKAPKLYFYDTALACHLLGLRSVKDLDLHFLRGALFENMVIMEAVKKQLNKGQVPHVYFWRDQAGNEVDLLVEQGTSLVPMELKSSETVPERGLENIRFWEKLTGQISEEACVIYGGEVGYSNSKGRFLSWNQPYPSSPK